MPSHLISIRGARTHNLKNISVEIPHRQITAVTGPSGSGKSSLAFNTLYAEGQRRFVESMSTYVRQFLERMERPDIDAIDGILPSIAVEQRNSVKNARSTVATATELADYLRLFMTYCGETFCPGCKGVVTRDTPQSVLAHLFESLGSERIVLLAPVSLTSDYRTEILQQLLKGGFYRVWHDGAVADLKELDCSGMSSIEVLTGRNRVTEESRPQIIEAIEQGFSLGRGVLNILQSVNDEWVSHRFSSHFACNRCGTEYDVPSPHLFSFNSPLGACEECQGYGRTIGVDMGKVIPVRSQRLDELPVAPWNSAGYEDCYEDLQTAAKKYKLRLDVPVDELTPQEWDILYKGRGKWYGIKGFFEWLETKKYKIHVRVKLAKYRSYDTCHKCGGTRLKPEALYVRFRDLTVADLYAMDIKTARKFWEFLPLSKGEEDRAGHLRREIVNRLIYLDEVGLSYLTLDRQTRTLSGGEAQRINLSAALGSGLTETLYVVDEPTVGLHARDSERLLHILRRLRNRGNTVVVVEHDPQLIAGSDHIIELGPGAGELGGQLTWSGRTQQYLESREKTGIDQDPTPEQAPATQSISLIEASEHNLRNIDVTIPLGRLVAVTGVSGSGKSTLIRDCLYNGYQRIFRGVSKVDVGKFSRIEGVEHIEDMVLVDQSPIGRSARSNPATYVKAWDEIRKLVASSTSAKLNGVTAGMLSFNTTGGRCDTCEGAGYVTIDMQFLADIEVVCEGCGGRRFNEKVLKVKYKGKTVDDLLDLTVDQAIRFFIDRRPVIRKLDSLRSVGLGYLRLGQSTASLSGGEAQRLKLASFLSGTEKTSTRRLFLFDEPTTGLHESDVRQLIRTFRDLISRGNSVVVIEHNLQMIAAADHIIDLGPDGGDQGGQVIAIGSPEEIAANEASITGRFLRGHLEVGVAKQVSVAEHSDVRPRQSDVKTV